MTESEWLECADPAAMVAFWVQNPFDIPYRKLRLFSCACVRKMWERLTDERSRTSVEVAERFADSIATDDERLTAYKAAGEAAGEAGAWESGAEPPVNGAVEWVAMSASAGPPGGASWMALEITEMAAKASMMAKQAALLRDIIGNPFSPISISPIWLTPTVLNLVQAAYDERIMPSGELDAARLIVLSDALEEAGCDNAEILDHLRGPGPHVRGCFVVDLCLGLI